jgi:deoxyribodipyrimidine photo-lyase
VFPSLGDWFESTIKVQPYNLTQISNYEEKRDFPAVDATSYLSPHLRFGTVSVRKMVNWAANTMPF